MNSWPLFTLLLTVCSTPLLAKDIASDSEKSQMVRDIRQMKVDEKALNDAVASRTLSWLTGSSSNNDYVSVGRLANYFGFIGLRVASGHSLSRGLVAKHTLAALTPPQHNALIELVHLQKKPFKQLAESRYAVNRALEGLLVNEPMSLAEFTALGQRYGAHEAELGRVIATGLGEIMQTLSDEQLRQFKTIRNAHISGHGQDLPVRKMKLKLGKADKKELVNLAARLLSWTTGSPEFNDFEVVGKPSQHFGFVSLRVESNHGVKRGAVANQVMDLLTPEQQQVLARSAKTNVNQFAGFLQQRGQLMRALEVAQLGQPIDRAKVIEFGAKTGQIEAEMTWVQAQAMLSVRNTLSAEQSSALLAIRNTYTGGGNFAATDSLTRGRQLYSQCTLCHTDTSSVTGPKLNKVIGANVAADPAYGQYSSALQQFAKQNPKWTKALLSEFLASPKALIPGTYMSFSGFDNNQDREAVVEYLMSLQR